MLRVGPGHVSKERVHAGLRVSDSQSAWAERSDAPQPV